MQNEEHVLEKFNELYERELKKKEKEFLSCSSKNCKFNNRHRVPKNGKIGFCRKEEIISKMKDGIFICNDDETASRCKYYICSNTEETVLNMFYDDLRNPSICGYKYPKLAVLLWCLQQIPDSYSKNRSERLKNIIWSFFNNFIYIITFKWW